MALLFYDHDSDTYQAWTPRYVRERDMLGSAMMRGDAVAYVPEWPPAPIVPDWLLAVANTEAKRERALARLRRRSGLGVTTGYARAIDALNP